MTLEEFRHNIRRLSDKLEKELEAIERRNQKTITTFARIQDDNNRTVYIQPPPERD